MADEPRIDLMIQPGPCALCGETNYPLSMGGPAICPSCDCGAGDPFMLKRQLRDCRAQLEAMTKERDELLKILNGPEIVGLRAQLEEATKERMVAIVSETGHRGLAEIMADKCDRLAARVAKLEAGGKIMRAALEGADEEFYAAWDAAVKPDQP